MNFLPILLKDGYKVGHIFQYPENTSLISVNLTARKSRVPGVNHIVFAGLQGFIKEWLIDQFNANFFGQPRDAVILEYARVIDAYLGEGAPSSYTHMADLYDLGYLPIQIDAVPEGTRVPIGVPCMRITNTIDRFYWVPNFLETLMSAELWQMITSATTAFRYKEIFLRYQQMTDPINAFFPWIQGHDFSMRGMAGVDAAAKSGAVHLMLFYGTDTIPAIQYLRKHYDADKEGIIGMSVPATEHSVMCMHEKDNELGLFEHLITKVYPEGIVSIVSDTWDLWKVLTEYLPKLKDVVLNRSGKVVVRPDSGNPVDILCGVQPSKFSIVEHSEAEQKGVIELLWDVFGGTTNDEGYKVLDPHVGAIYGDAITVETAEEICRRLAEKKFASTNVVLGIGSYTYQYVTRDTYGMAFKATYGELKGPCEADSDCWYQGDALQKCLNECSRHEQGNPLSRAIFKDPITDTGGKKSARGWLTVLKNKEGELELFEHSTRTVQSPSDMLQPVFKDGKLLRTESLGTIRNRLQQQLDAVLQPALQ